MSKKCFLCDNEAVGKVFAIDDWTPICVPCIEENECEDEVYDFSEEDFEE